MFDPEGGKVHRHGHRWRREALEDTLIVFR